MLSDMDDLNTPYFFDVSTLATLKSLSLVEHINRAGLVLYERQKVHS